MKRDHSKLILGSAMVFLAGLNVAQCRDYSRREKREVKAIEDRARLEIAQAQAIETNSVHNVLDLLWACEARAKADTRRKEPTKIPAWDEARHHE